MTEIDKRVIRGLFIKGIKDFDEYNREKMKNLSLLDRLKIAADEIESSLNSDNDEEVFSRLLRQKTASNLRYYAKKKRGGSISSQIDYPEPYPPQIGVQIVQNIGTLNFT